MFKVDSVFKEFSVDNIIKHKELDTNLNHGRNGNWIQLPYIIIMGFNFECIDKNA